MFWDNFLNLCDQRGIKPNPLAKKLGIASGTITAWKSGSIPNGDSLIKIADELNCSIDFLLDRTENPQSHKSNNNVSVGNVSSNSGAIGVGNTVTNNTDLDAQTSEMLEIFKKLNTVDKARVLVQADELTKRKG